MYTRRFEVNYTRKKVQQYCETEMVKLRDRATFLKHVMDNFFSNNYSDLYDINNNMIK